MRAIRRIALKSIAGTIATLLVLWPGSVGPDSGSALAAKMSCSKTYARCLSKCRGSSHCYALCDMVLADCISG